MKRRSFFIIGAVLAVLCMACQKKISDSQADMHTLAGDLAGSENFALFAKGFILNFKELTDYYRSGKPIDRTVFVNRLKEAGDDNTRISAVYVDYGLSFDQAVVFKNKVDNSLLQLFIQYPALTKYSEQQVWQVISEAITAGFASGTPSWQALRSVHTDNTIGALELNTLNPLLVKAPQPGLDLSEVWICLKEAIGFGASGILGIAGLQKLASEGIQEIVITASKWLAKRAGWIGAAIAVFDFSACIYREAND